MNRLRPRKHAIDSLFSLLLFGIFVLFLLFLLLFAAETYRSTVKGLDENQNLRTATSYLTTKFRQHDSQGDVSISNFQDMEALCFQDRINDKDYVTYIYLQGTDLKELFTMADSQASADMGTTLAQLAAFSVEETPEGYYKITMEDENGADACFLLHPGSPDMARKEN